MPGEINIEKPKLDKPESPKTPSEKILVPETRAEKAAPISEQLKEAAKPLEKSGEGSIVASSQAQAYQKKQAAAIDTILSEGLNDIYLKMKPTDQANFKKKGEETVLKIAALLSQTKVKVGKIVELIRRWLRLVPGINKFFLEQEAKIKADKIIRLKDK